MPNATTANRKPDVIPVKMRRDAWDEFSRIHRIKDGERAAKGLPQESLCDALSKFVMEHLSRSKKTD